MLALGKVLPCTWDTLPGAKSASLIRTASQDSCGTSTCGSSTAVYKDGSFVGGGIAASGFSIARGTLVRWKCVERCVWIFHWQKLELDVFYGHASKLEDQCKAMVTCTVVQHVWALIDVKLCRSRGNWRSSDKALVLPVGIFSMQRRVRQSSQVIPVYCVRKVDAANIGLLNNVDVSCKNITYLFQKHFLVTGRNLDESPGT